MVALVLQIQGRESGPSGRWGRVARCDSSVAKLETAVLDLCGAEWRRFRRHAKVVVFLGINRLYILYTSLRSFLAGNTTRKALNSMSMVFVIFIRFHSLQVVPDNRAHEVGLNPERPSHSSAILRPDEIRRITGDGGLTID